MAHNGILPVATVDDESDTVAFSRMLREAILADPEWFQHAFVTDVGEWIGKCNKLALLTSNGDLILVNEDGGFWKDSIWYSNRSAEFDGYTAWDARQSVWNGTRRYYSSQFDDSDVPAFATSDPYAGDPYEWHYENEASGYAQFKGGK
jgi:hypothetical protein